MIEKEIKIVRKFDALHLKWRLSIHFGLFMAAFILFLTVVISREMRLSQSPLH